MAEQQEILPTPPTVVELDALEVLASMSQFARAFDVHYEDLRRQLIEHGVEPAGRRHGHAVFALRQVYRVLHTENAAVDPDKLKPFARRAYFQSENERIRLERECGRLLDVVDVEQCIARIFKIVVKAFDVGLDVLERDVGMTPKQAARIEAHFDRMREELVAEVKASQNDGDKNGEQQLASQPEASSQNGGALAAAEAFLRNALGSGAQMVTELLAQAAAESISEATLRRAKKSIGVAARRAGKAWAWEIER